jgi:DNA replication protein DnaC
MSTIEITCTCGAEFELNIEGSNSRWLEAMAKRCKCEDCADRLDKEAEVSERFHAREARRSRCQMPKKLRGELLVNLPAKPGQLDAIQLAKVWASSKHAEGLMLTGPIGTGKTRIAAAACWTRLEWASCVYVSVAHAMTQLSASLTDEGRREAVRNFHGTGAVVLDDLDKARPSEYGREQIFAAIDVREQAGTPLLVTSNLTPSEIADRFGESVASRLAGYCEIVELDGDDLRLAA